MKFATKCFALAFVISVIIVAAISGSILNQKSVKENDLNNSGSTPEASATFNLTSYFNLRNISIPYSIVNIAPFNNTLATFEFPATLANTLHYEYISIVWVGNGTVSYLFNANSKATPVVFSHSLYLGSYSKQFREVSGNVTAVGGFGAKMWVTPLPGGYNDPTTTLYLWVELFSGNTETGYVNATGIFNWVYGGVITGITGIESSTAPYDGYYWCSGSPSNIVQGAGQTIGSVQETGQAEYCAIIGSDWWTAWPGVALNSLNGVPYYSSTPYWDSGWRVGCACTTFNYPPVPT